MKAELVMFYVWISLGAMALLGIASDTQTFPHHWGFLWFVVCMSNARVAMLRREMLKQLGATPCESKT